MQLTIDIRSSAVDKILYFLEHLKDDVSIITRSDSHGLDIEMIEESDPDYTYIVKGREERKNHPENYGTLDDVNWD